jgi:hypothetical membrane protein
MLKLTGYIGLLNVIFFLTSLSILINKSNFIDLKKHTFSDLSKDKKLAKYFNTSLFIFAIFQIIFALNVCRTFTHRTAFLEIILFILGGGYY